MASFDFSSQTPSSMGVSINLTNFDELGLLPDSDYSINTDIALADSFVADLEPLDASITVSGISELIDELIDEPLTLDLSLPSVTSAGVDINIDPLTGANTVSTEDPTNTIVDNLVTVDELLAESNFPTQTPDLVSVGNFRSGTPTDDGNPRTFVDYTFDEPAELSGGDATNFNLVPVDGGSVLNAKELIEGDNTNVYTIAYLGTLEQTDIARGFIDSGTVRGSGEKPTNPLESADVSNDGNNSDPNLVSVVPNVATNEITYTFDQEVNIDDDAGFGFYQSDGKEYDGSMARQSTPTTVAVEFVDVEVSSAVGATVDNGAVADLQDESNQPDEVLVDDSV